MEEKFKSICGQINNAKEPAEIAKIINEWEIDNQKYDECIDVVCNNVLSIDKEKLPHVIDALYRSNEKFKGFLFRVVLELTYDKIPYITRLESAPMFKAKYELMKQTLVKVATNSYNGVADCLYIIILNADPKGELLTPEEFELLRNGIKTKLKLMLNYFEKTEKIEPATFMSLEILFDLATYINDAEILELMGKIVDTRKMNISSSMFLVKAFANNNVLIAKEILTNLATDILYASRTFRILENLNKKDIFPKDYANQEYLAKSAMVDWLVYPTELAELPTKIEFVEKFEENEEEFYIFKYESSKEGFKEKGEMLGVAGGYKKAAIPTAISSGFVYSELETITDNPVEQAKALIEKIREHWRQRAAEANK